tara:strand:+ start:489 stop:653 length:165 start_codon:yes stop_codon:yes gene_type:complete
LGGNSSPFPGSQIEVAGRDLILLAGFSGKELDLAVQNARKELPGFEVRRILLQT